MKTKSVRRTVPLTSYEIIDRRPGDVAENYADPSLAKELLGWVAKRDLVNMCKTGYHWQSMNPNGYDM